MLLDLFPEQQAETERLARARPAVDLPLTFGEAFGVAAESRSRFAASTAENVNRYDQWSTFLDRFEEMTGESLPNPEVGDGRLIRDQIAKRYEARRGDVGDLKLPSEQDIATGAEVVAGEARAAEIAAGSRVQTFGGTAGLFLGQASSAAIDPLNIAGMALGAPAAAGILRTAAVEAFAAGLSETAVQAKTYDFKTRVDPNFGLGEAAGEVGIAALTGGALGGGVRGLAALWGRLRASGADLPRHVRDAGNVVESEAQIASTEPFGLPAGESRHASALAKAVEDVQAGRAVDVSKHVGPTVATRGLADIEADPTPPARGADVSALPDRALDELLATRVADAAPVEAFDAVAARRGAEVFARGDATIQIDGVGPFGPVASGFSGRWPEAVDWMRSWGGGEARGVFEHPDIGPIDVPWGRYDAATDGGSGLAKIAAKHPDVVPDLPNIVASMPVESRSANRVILASPDHRAVVRLDYDGEDKTWLMTAYSKGDRRQRIEGTTERPDGLQADASSASPAPENVAPQTPIGQTAARALDDMTPEQIVDAASTPEAAEAAAHRADNMQAAEPRPVYMTRTAEDGTISVETRDYHEMMREIDDEIRAADELKACVVGKEPEGME